MSLTEKISAEIITAMKGGNKITLEALRAAKTAFLLAKSEKGTDALLSPDEELLIIQKLVKQRKESADIYKTNNRMDLYEKEVAEAEVLERYLPAKMNEADLETALRAIIEKTGAKSPADMGKVMGAATKELAGRADGKEISVLVKKLLGS